MARGSAQEADTDMENRSLLRSVSWNRFLMSRKVRSQQRKLSRKWSQGGGWPSSWRRHTHAAAFGEAALRQSERYQAAPAERQKAFSFLAATTVVLAMLCVWKPPLAKGSDFQASGVVTLEPSPEDPTPNTNALRSAFNIGTRGSQWVLHTLTGLGYESWLSYDGTNYYRLTQERRAPYNGGGFVTSKSPASSLVELDKMLLFAFGQGTNLCIGSDGQFRVPFLGDPDPASTVYEATIERSPLPPGIPVRAAYFISAEKLALVLRSLTGADNARWRAYLENMYSTDLKASHYELLSSSKDPGLQLPLKFEFRQPYRDRGQPRSRRFLGEVTNCVLQAVSSVLPPLRTNTYVQDARLGASYQYKSTDQRWLEPGEAAAHGKLMLPPPPLSPLAQSLAKYVPAAKVVFRGMLILLVLASLWLVLRRAGRRKQQ